MKPSSDDASSDGASPPLLGDAGTQSTFVHPSGHVEQGQILCVAVPKPLNRLFSYRLPEHLTLQAQVGKCVRVPFGSRVLRGFIVEPPRPIREWLQAGFAMGQLKDILAVDDDPPISEEILKLCRWVHQFYCVALGEVLRTAAPQVKKPSRRALEKPKTQSTRPSEFTEFHNAHSSDVLTDEQQTAVALGNQLFASKKSEVLLLHGVTGSGKTLVYLELTAHALQRRKSVLILVPEIALTTQLYRQFLGRFGEQVGLWHSAMSNGKRMQQSMALKIGQIRVLIGARSAVFAPLQDLGLLIVDEEHEATYKQDDRVRYQARDVAIVRGKLTSSLVVLGSATPSLETRENVACKKYHITALTQRISSHKLPQIEVIDLQVAQKAEKTQAILSYEVLAALQATQAAGEQAIVYLNRRGFSACLLCQECGAVNSCPSCSISLTFYKKKTRLACHLCGHQEEVSSQCKKCSGHALVPLGAGTESLEADLARLLPEARMARLDRDQITSVKRLEKILDDFRGGKTDILLGTQMLVKGHDFPGVTLVVVVLADALFRWPDFRAAERAYQVLQQVAGRAGRGARPGRVLIQTYDPSHPVLRALQDPIHESEFLEDERALRQALRYPPWGRLAKLRFEHTHREQAVLRATQMSTLLHSQCNAKLEILGPSEAFLEKVKNLYRWDILLKAQDIQTLQKSLALAQEACLREKWQFLADIDPYGL